MRVREQGLVCHKANVLARTFHSSPEAFLEMQTAPPDPDSLVEMVARAVLLANMVAETKT
jgi:hypothetical protein